jgi:hypothetical protein
MSTGIESAVDIIYSLPDKIQQISAKLAVLEARSAMIEGKLNAILKALSDLASDPADSPAYAADEPAHKEEASEVMEIRSKAPKKASEPFNFGKQMPAAPADVISQPSGAPITIEPPKEEPTGVRIPVRAVDPMPQSAIQAEPVSERQTSALIRGRLKEREGSSIAAVDVKIFDDKNTMVKKTKTAATGEWIAMLPPGEYTVEFTKPGQKPLFKPITVISGKKEIEVLI